jgi:hypothetical protein
VRAVREPTREKDCATRNLTGATQASRSFDLRFRAADDTRVSDAPLFALRDLISLLVFCRSVPRYEVPCIHLAPRLGERQFHVSGTGGAFAWPAGEPWPASQEGIPFHGALEFWKDSFPDLPFPDGRDLLQILWLPIWPAVDEWLAGTDSMQWRWRDSAAEDLILRLTNDSNWDNGLVLREGNFQPRHAMDSPGSTLLDYLRTYAGGDEFRAEERNTHNKLLRSVQRMIFNQAAQTPEEPEPYSGMKLFGHPYPIQTIERESVVCNSCQTPMRLLFSTGNPWQSQEPIGLPSLDGMAYIYVCQVCADRPLRGLLRTS